MPESRTTTSIADNLDPLMRTDQEKIAIGEIVDKVEQGESLAPVVFVLTLPVLLPLPPGVSLFLALPLLVVAPQMALGRKRLWMPERLARQSIDTAKLQKGLKRLLPWLERAERVVRPRLTFLTGRLGAVLVGLVCTAMAVVLVLPLPFANFLPALTVLLISLGLARRDGAAVIAGLGLLAASVTAVVWGLHGARLGLAGLRHML